MSETETTAKPHEQERPTTSTEPAEQGHSSGPSFLAVLLGGVLAGGIGYLAAYYTNFGLFQTDTGESDEISAMIEEQIARLDDVETRLDGADDSSAVDAVQSEVSSVTEQLTGLAARLDGIEGQSGPDLTPVDERISALEGQIAELSLQVGNPETTETDATQSQQLADLTSELDALTARIEEQTALLDRQSAMLDEQTAAIEEARTAAASEANRIAGQSALASIRAALESGESFADAVGALESATGSTVPEPLSGPAGTGVITLASLQDSFPPAARDALSASVAETAGDNPVDRFGAFLRAQTNARSLGEQEGDSADAILSRAEARLNEGDLQATLDELQALPEQGRTAMSDWIERAQTRVAAKSALSELSAS